MSIKKYRDADNDGRADSALSMSEIKVEHGGDSDPSLKEYYRNERFVQSGDFDLGFNNNYSAGTYAIKDPNDPNNKMIVKSEPVAGGTTFVFGVLDIQPGGNGIINDPRYADREREVFIDTVHVEGTGNATTGKYRVKTRDTENAFIPETGQPISFSDLYGTKRESDGYSFDASIGKLYITVTKDNSLANMDFDDNDFLLDAPGSNIPRDNFIPLVTSKNLLERSGVYQDKSDEVNHIEFFIAQDIVVYSPDSNRPAFDISGIPSRITVTLNLAGRIVGGGGDGGNGDYNYGSASRNGKDGSTGLKVNHDGKFILNVQSDSDYAICGGGGGGAAGYFRFSDGKVVGAGGGGGAGRSLGGSARYDVAQFSKTTYNPRYTAASPSHLYAGPAGITNQVKYYFEPGYSQYWDRLEGLDSLVDRFVDSAFLGRTSHWADRESAYSSRYVKGYDADRRAMSSNSARVTTTGYEEINRVVRAEQLHGGAGAGGTMIWKTNPQWHPVNLPYTKPDYINEMDASSNGSAPEFVQNVPPGFTNGWIIEHIDGTGGGYYSIVEEGKIIYSNYASKVRELKAIGLEALDDYGKGEYRFGLRLAQVHSGTTQQLRDDQVNRNWIWYERVDFTDDGAPPMTENQSNFFDDPQQAGGGEFRAGNGSPSNPPYYHGGGFTKSNNTSSPGDVHKYLYYPVKKFDQGIVRMFFPNNSTTIRNGWPAPNDDVVSGVTVGTGANGSIKGNPGTTNLSYKTAIVSGTGDRRMHANAVDVSIGGYGGCTKSPQGGDAGIGASALAPVPGETTPNYVQIYGGGGGGGDFGAAGGDAKGIYFVGTSYSTLDIYTAYGGQGGPAIVVNKRVHLLDDAGKSAVPIHKVKGQVIAEDDPTPIGYTQQMTTGYNTHIYTGSNTRHIEAGYGEFSQFPGVTSTVSIPYGSLPDTSINLNNGNESIRRLACIGTENNIYKQVILEVKGGNNRDDGGWTTLQIGGYTFKRSSATYTSGSYLNTRKWAWSVSSNPFGTSAGATRSISIS